MNKFKRARHAQDEHDSFNSQGFTGITPIIHDWHDPRNEDCAQNRHPLGNCICKRKVNRKPFRVVKVNDPTAANYQRDGRIILELHPNGLIVLRERGRRKRYETTVGKIYSGLVWREAMTLAKTKKARKR